MRSRLIRGSALLAGMAVLASLTLVQPAKADNALHLGGYNGTIINFTANGIAHHDAGGNIIPNTLNGEPLPYLYCVQYNVNVGVPGDYNHTAVNSTGLIAGNALTNAGEVAWLLTHIAPTISNGDLYAQAGLQAAIWYEVTGGSTGGFTIGSNLGNINTDFNADLALLLGSDTTTDSYKAGTGNTSELTKLFFITPSDGNRNFQGLVALSTPEPSTTVMAATGGIALAVLARRRRRTKAK